MRKIEIDDDVYGELERHASGFEQPNDVLRRLLLKEQTQPTGATHSAKTGALKPLVDAGLVAEGDRLVHHQKRKGRTFEASVSAGGEVITERGPWSAPSPALADLVGTQIDGWANWTHEPTGKTLRALRHGLGG